MEHRDLPIEVNPLKRKINQLKQYLNASYEDFTPRDGIDNVGVEDPTVAPFTTQGLKRAEKKGWYVDIKNLDTNLHQVEGELTKQFENSNGSWIDFIYNGQNPKVFYEYYSLNRQIPRVTGRGVKVNLKNANYHPGLEEHLFNMHYFFNYPIKGVTLADIDKMQTPLSMDDLNTINRYFSGPFLPFQDDKRAKNIRSSIVTFATLAHARSDEKLVVPHGVRPLFQNLTSYFDYVTGLTTRKDLTGSELEKFYFNLILSQKWMVAALGVYIPARLGVTPATTVKFFEDRLAHLMVPMFWKQFAEKLSITFNLSHKKDSLPPDLEQYKFYNFSNEKRAADHLSNFIQEQNLSPKEQVQASEEADNLKGRYRLYKKALRTEIFTSPDQRVTLDLKNKAFAKQLIITSQNKDTIMMILKFNDKKNTHLLLEETKNSFVSEETFYGFPPKILNENPHASDLILPQVIGPIINHLQSKYPDIEKTNSETEKKEQNIIDFEAAAAKKNREERKKQYILERNQREAEKNEQTKKLKANSQLDDQSTLPEKPEIEEKPKFHVVYSKQEVERLLNEDYPDVVGFQYINPLDQIRRYLPKGLQPKIARQIMEEVNDFEYGRALGTKALTDIDNVIELKSGDYRIILEHLDARYYSLEHVIHRKNLHNLLKNKYGLPHNFD